MLISFIRIVDKINLEYVYFYIIKSYNWIGNYSKI